MNLNGAVRCGAALSLSMTGDDLAIFFRFTGDDFIICLSFWRVIASFRIIDLDCFRLRKVAKMVNNTRHCR
jgi:hypothetical protein